jgi:PAS domain-containing protein
MRLQSTNEELKSANEDMFSLNRELERKNDALSTLNRDYDHLLASAEIGTVFLDAELRLRRFSPGVSTFLSLRAQDIGRPITDIVYHAGDQEAFIAALSEVAAGSGRVEREIELSEGRWYLERISPFRGADGRRDGQVITWTEISEVKHQEPCRASCRGPHACSGFSMRCRTVSNRQSSMTSAT